MVCCGMSGITESRLTLSVLPDSTSTVGSPNSVASRAHGEQTSILSTTTPASSVMTRKSFSFVTWLHRRQMKSMAVLLVIEHEAVQNG